jgi:hypothetical protein
MRNEDTGVTLEEMKIAPATPARAAQEQFPDAQAPKPAAPAPAPVTSGPRREPDSRAVAP